MGIGTDIVEVKRISNVIDKKGDKFLQKLLAPAEISYIKKKNSNVASIAGLWAAKEAVAKALGSGIRFSFHDIQVSHTEKGAPQVKLTNQAAKLAKSLGVQKVWVSISHSRANAIAFAVAEGQ